MKIVDLTGKRFGRLVVIRCTGSRKQGKRRFKFWLCQCDCGGFTEVRTAHLTTGQTSGCGCKQKLPKGESAFNALLASYKRNAKSRNLTFNLTKGQFKRLTQEPCFYCGTEPSMVVDRLRLNGIYVYNGIDRIDSSLGYSIGNCVPCCKTCNWMKCDMNQSDFLVHVHKICTVSSVV